MAIQLTTNLIKPCPEHFSLNEKKFSDFKSEIIGQWTNIINNIIHLFFFNSQKAGMVYYIPE